jgi:hypothetical protein
VLDEAYNEVCRIHHPLGARPRAIGCGVIVVAGKVTTESDIWVTVQVARVSSKYRRQKE